MKYFILLGALLWTCQQTRNYDSKYSNILKALPVTDLSPAFEGESIRITLETIVDSLTYIPLKVPADQPVSVIKNVVVDSVFLAVTDDKENILCFNINGDLLWSVRNIGRGPGEYLGVNRLEISAKQDLLVILDGRTSNVIRYRLKTGEFIDQFRSDLSPYFIKLLPNGDFLFYVTRPMYWEHGHSIWLVSDRGIRKDKIWKRYDHIELNEGTTIHSSNVFPCLDGGWFIYEKFSFGIVKFDPLSFNVEPFFKYDFIDSYAIPYDHDFNGNAMHRAEVLNGNSIEDVFIVGKYYIFKARKKMQRILLGFDSHSGRCGEIGYDGLMDDISGGPEFYPGGYNHDGVGWDMVEVDKVPEDYLSNFDSSATHSEYVRLVHFAE